MSKTFDIPNAIWKKFKIPVPIREYRFTNDRRWRSDFSWPSKKVALEIEGGIWINGRHNRPEGYIRDMEKYNYLNINGWLLLRYAPNDINFFEIKKVLSNREDLHNYD